jgi:hypothetical protein
VKWASISVLNTLMSNSDRQSKVTIEDLLHLKKSERPSADFWAGFERELRQKQLSALVEKRAWWHDLPRFFARRAYLPIGATAVLTFTLISVKYYTPLHVAQGDGATAIPLAALNNAGENGSALASSVPVSSPLVNRAESQPAVTVEHAPVIASVQTVSEVAPEMPAKVESLGVNSPSARSIAANFARLEQSEPELINSVLGSRLSSPSRVQASSAPVVELASLQVNGARRSRLVARYNDRQPNAELVAPDAVRERLSRKLGDSDYNDHFSRIGLKGDKFSVRF